MAPDEAFRMSLISLVENVLAFLLNLLGLTAMDGGWDQQPQRGVSVMMV